MRNIINVFKIAIVLFGYQAFAQPQPPALIYLCDNGDFEMGNGAYYTFDTDILTNTTFSCSIDAYTLGLSPLILTTVDDFSNQATIVSVGFDPVLSALTVPVNLDRVYEGNFAIKLNDDSADNGVTSMTKAFDVTTDVATFNYSLIMQYNALEAAANIPYFSVRLYSNSNVLLDEFCINPVDDAELFIDSGNESGNPILYTGWRCASLNIGDIAAAKLVFLINDCTATVPDDYATVYIDNICNDPCSCPFCPDVEIDVPGSGFDHQHGINCVKAYNTVNNDAIAEYHAGFEVILLPGEPGDGTAVPGFESLYGSDGYYYIAECEEGGPIPRRNIIDSQSDDTGLQIYPNPTNSELNIQAGDSDIRAVSLMTLDGKVVFVKQGEEVNTKDYRLDMSGMSQGIYILSVETKDGAVTTHKIIRE